MSESTREAMVTMEQQIERFRAAHPELREGVLALARESGFQDAWALRAWAARLRGTGDAQGKPSMGPRRPSSSTAWLGMLAPDQDSIEALRASLLLNRQDDRYSAGFPWQVLAYPALLFVIAMVLALTFLPLSLEFSAGFGFGPPNWISWLAHPLTWLLAPVPVLVVIGVVVRRGIEAQLVRLRITARGMARLLRWGVPREVAARSLVSGWRRRTTIAKPIAYLLDSTPDDVRAAERLEGFAEGCLSGLGSQARAGFAGLVAAICSLLIGCLIVLLLIAIYLPLITLIQNLT